MKEEAAASLAEAHGIVCHLTSLVLVDEAAEAQDGLPAQRKVPLMSPCSADTFAAAPMAPSGALPRSFSRRRAGGPASKGMFSNPMHGSALEGPAPSSFGLDDAGPTGGWLSEDDNGSESVADCMPVAPELVPKGPAPLPLRSWIGRIDWKNAEALRQGDTRALPGDLMGPVMSAAILDEVVELARALNIGTIVVVIALLAKASSPDRNAGRVFRAMLSKADPAKVEAALRVVGL
jgi:hypothetical protein